MFEAIRAAAGPVLLVASPAFRRRLPEARFPEARFPEARPGDARAQTDGKSLAAVFSSGGPLPWTCVPACAQLLGLRGGEGRLGKRDAMSAMFKGFAGVHGNISAQGAALPQWKCYWSDDEKESESFKRKTLKNSEGGAPTSGLADSLRID